MDEHKHNNNSFEDLLKNMKTGKTDGLDDFEREALEGFDMLDSQEEALNAKAELDKRIHAELFTEEKRRKPVIYWFAAAGLFLVIGLSVLFVLNNKDMKGDSVAAADEKEIKNFEKEAALSAPMKEPAATVSEEKKISDAEGERKVTVAATKSNENSKGQSADLKQDEAEKKEIQSNMARVVSPNGPAQTQTSDNTAKPNAPKEDIVFSSSRSDGNKSVDANAEVAKTANENFDDGGKNAMLDEQGKLKREESEKLKERSVLKKATVTDQVAAKDVSGERDEPKKEAKAKTKSSGKKTAESEARPQTASSPANNYPSGYTNYKQDNDKESNLPVTNGATAGTGSTTKTETDAKVPASVQETELANKNADKWNSPDNSCYYAGGKDQINKDLTDKLTTKGVNKKFDVILSVNERKKVEKVFYLNVYDLTKEEQSKVTDVLKSLEKFNFYIQPNKKSLSEYKLEYRP